MSYCVKDEPNLIWGHCQELSVNQVSVSYK